MNTFAPNQLNRTAPRQQSILLSEYMALAAATDRLPAGDLKPVLLGLFGEVGSIMATAKKLHREKSAYVGFRHAVEEEFGDALWYFAALCRRLAFPLDEIMSAATRNGKYRTAVAAGALTPGPISEVSSLIASPAIDDALLNLGVSAADLLSVATPDDTTRLRIVAFADCYLHALQAANVAFNDVVHANLSKARGRFLKPEIADLPSFDARFPQDERLPDQFEIVIRQRSSGKTCLQWNGVFIGDPLSDNIRDPDGYRFHDVFHFANAAVLHWSPTFRALIKHKRRSDPALEEAQDSGRAIVVEEGLSAWIFSCAKQLDFFEGQSGVSFDLLKTVGQFVSGYEVDACPLKLWEDAILQGYGVFRQLRANSGGIITGDRTQRRIEYRPLAAGSSS